MTYAKVVAQQVGGGALTPLGSTWCKLASFPGVSSGEGRERLVHTLPYAFNWGEPERAPHKR